MQLISAFMQLINKQSVCYIGLFMLNLKCQCFKLIKNQTIDISVADAQ